MDLQLKVCILDLDRTQWLMVAIQVLERLRAGVQVHTMPWHRASPFSENQSKPSKQINRIF